MKKFGIQLSIDCRLEQVCLLRAAVRAIAAEIGFDESTCLEIQLGVTEAVNNVIEHSCKFSSDRGIVLDLEVGTGFLELRITDDGAPLPLDDLARCMREAPRLAEPGKAEHSDRGRGLWIIRLTMDSVTFDRKDGKNYLYLRKKLPAQPTQPAG